MTGAAAAAVVASRRPLTAPQTFSPYLTKNGVGSTVSIAVLTLAAISAMYCWCRSTSSRVPSLPGGRLAAGGVAGPAEGPADEVLPRIGERGGGRVDVAGDVLGEVAEVDRRPTRVDDVHEHQRVVVGQGG